MPHFRSPILAVLMLPLALAGCGSGGGGDAEQALQPDPAIVAALAAPIMTDPDLAAMNRGNAALEIGLFDGIPAWSPDPDEIAAARGAAAKLAGGLLRSAPEPGSGPVPDPLTARQFAAGLAGAARPCLTALSPGFAWAASMPTAASLYPGSHVEEAAGAHKATCALRAVRYVTAAPAQDVLDFHFTMLSAAGYEVERTSHDGRDLLTARKGRAGARVLVESGVGGMTEVALVTGR